MRSVRILLNRLTAKDTSKDYKYNTNRAKNDIDELCTQYLVDFDDVFVFEVSPSVLDIVVNVIDKEPLSLKYDIMQVDETLFRVMLKDLRI